MPLAVLTQHQSASSKVKAACTCLPYTPITDTSTAEISVETRVRCLHADTIHQLKCLFGFGGQNGCRQATASSVQEQERGWWSSAWAPSVQWSHEAAETDISCLFMLSGHWNIMLYSSWWTMWETTTSVGSPEPSREWIQLQNNTFTTFFLKKGIF